MVDVSLLFAASAESDEGTLFFSCPVLLSLCPRQLHICVSHWQDWNRTPENQGDCQLQNSSPQSKLTYFMCETKINGSPELFSVEVLLHNWAIG